MATLQVKGMDDNLYRALAARAAQENRSISQEVVTMIQDALSQPGLSPQRATAEFLAMAGTWQDDRSTEEIVRDLRKHRRGGRRFGSGTSVFD